MIIGFFLISDYQSFEHVLVNFFPFQGIHEKLKQGILSEQYFSRFQVISIGLSTFIIFCFCLMFLSAQRVVKSGAEFLVHCRNSLIFSWNNLSKKQKQTFLLFFILLLMYRLYLMLEYPFNIDELFSYHYLVDRGFAVSVFYYPGPNNHILYTLICNLFDLGSIRPEFVMKLPAFLIGMLLVFTSFIISLRYFKFNMALVVTVLLALSYQVNYYSITGRGYVLMLLFFILALHFSYDKLFGDNRRAEVMAIQCLSLGFYTIPVFLLPAVSLFLFLLLNILTVNDKKRGIRLIVLFRIYSIAALIIILLYLPVVLLNGIKALAGNSWIAGSMDGQIHSAGNYFMGLGDFLVDYPNGIYFVGLLLGGIIVTCLLQKKTTALLILIAFVIPPVILILVGFQPFFRVWIYLIPVIILLIGLTIQSLFDKKEGWILWILFAAGIIISIISIQVPVNKGFRYYRQLDDFLAWSEKLKSTGIWTNDDTYLLYLKHQDKEQNLYNSISAEDKSKAGILIYKKPMELLEGMSLVYSNDFVIVYRKEPAGF